MRKALALLLALAATAYAGPQANDDEDPLGKAAPAPSKPAKKATDDDAPAKKATPKKSKPKPPADDDADAAPAKKPAAKKGKPKPVVDDDDEAPAPKKTAKKADAKKKPASHDDEADAAPPPKKTAKKPGKKPAVADAPPKTVPAVEIDMDVAADPAPAAPVAEAKPLDQPASPHADADVDASVVAHANAREHAHASRHWTIMAGVAYVDPLSSSEPLVLSDVSGPASLAVQNGPIAGSGASVGDATIPALILGYKLHPKLSLEIILGLPFTVKFRATGTLANMSLAPTALGIPTGVQPLGPELGEAKAAPPILTLVYSPLAGGRVQPYIGGGASVLIAYDAKVTNPVLTQVAQPDMKLTPAPGLVAQAGVTVPITDRIFARVDVKFIGLMKADATVEHIQVKTPDLPLFDSVEVGTAKMSVTVNPLIVQAGIGANF